MDRLSPLDSAFLDIEDRHAALHIGGLAVFAGPVPTAEEMARVYERGIARDPRYRKRMRRSPLALARPAWVDDPDFDPEYHLRRTAVPAPGGPAELDRLIGRIMSVRLDEARPPWEAWVVEGLADGQWALLTKLHHCLVDGLGGMSLFTDLLDEAEPRPEPAALPHSGLTALEIDVRARMRAARRLAHDAVATGLAPRHALGTAAQLTTGAMGYLAGLRPTAASSLVGPLGTPRRFRTFTVDLEDVLAVRRALGGTVNDVALAMVTRGFRALLLSRGEAPTPHAVRCLVPVSTRATSARSDGNEVSALLVELPVDFADVEVTHAAVAARTRTLKRSHEADAGRVGVMLAGLVPPPLLSAALRATRLVHQRVLTTVTTNVPGPRQPVHLLGRRMLALYPYVPIAERIRIGVAFTSYADRMHFGVTCDRDSVGDADVLIGGITDGLAALVKVAESVEGARP